jgi:hypothetical protein
MDRGGGLTFSIKEDLEFKVLRFIQIPQNVPFPIVRAHCTVRALINVHIRVLTRLWFILQYIFIIYNRPSGWFWLIKNVAANIRALEGL